jgi:uncharacterized coiled-coil protein SlyX
MDVVSALVGATLALVSGGVMTYIALRKKWMSMTVLSSRMRVQVAQADAEVAKAEADAAQVPMAQQKNLYTGYITLVEAKFRRMEERFDAFREEHFALRERQAHMEVEHRACEERDREKTAKIEKLERQNAAQQTIMDKLLGWLRHFGFKIENTGSGTHDSIPHPPPFPPSPTTPGTGPA